MTLQALIADLLVSQPLRRSLSEDPQGVGDDYGVSADQIEPLVAKMKGVELTALSVFAKRVSNLERLLPQTVKAVRQQSQPEDIVKAFCRDCPPEREGPTSARSMNELQRFASYLSRPDVSRLLPGYVSSLARYELRRAGVRLMQDWDVEAANGDHSLPAGVRLASGVSVDEYQHDVIEIEAALARGDSLSTAPETRCWVVLHWTGKRFIGFRVGRVPYRILSLCDGTMTEQQIAARLGDEDVELPPERLSSVLTTAAQNGVVRPSR